MGGPHWMLSSPNVPPTPVPAPSPAASAASSWLCFFLWARCFGEKNQPNAARSARRRTLPSTDPLMVPAFTAAAAASAPAAVSAAEGVAVTLGEGEEEPDMEPLKLL